MKNDTPFLSIDALRGGDIILCYGDSKLDVVGKGIESVTDSKYKHAAICLDNKLAAEAMVLNGVQKGPIIDLVNRYSHVAVFRQPDAWDIDRLRTMNLFIDKIIRSGTKYNIGGIVRFVKRKTKHDKTLYQKLEAYFDGKLKPDAFEKNRYFCSELVCDCLIATGFISPSAAIAYKSETVAPGVLGRDPTFGTFLGYISLCKDYTVPESDEFMRVGRFNEIFGQQ